MASTSAEFSAGCAAFVRQDFDAAQPSINRSIRLIIITANFKQQQTS
jgi:hypothetical protein